MPTKKDAIAQLEQYFLLIQDADSRKQRVPRTAFSSDENAFETIKRRLEGEIAQYRKDIEAVLDKLDRMPERHWLRHSSKLGDFHKEGTFDESVFVMTKYPSDQDTDKPARELQAVIDCVVKGIRDRGYKPRIAAEKIHHRWLWDNVELYLFGCARGVAIVEDKYLPELNPNVAMEWGWMAGMGREVMFLREKTFEHDRADWKGLNEFAFVWNDPAPGVQAALDAFLPKR